MTTDGRFSRGPTQHSRTQKWPQLGVKLAYMTLGARNHSEAHDAHVTKLALAAGRGDKAALTEFIKLTQSDVWRLLAHLGGVEIADDLTQETYLRVIGALPRFAARSSARTWLLSLARRVWVDNIRHDMARPKKSHAEVENVDAPTESTWSEWVDMRILIDTLPADRREALILTQVLGFSYEEAAKIADVRVGTIRSRVARARADIIEASGRGKDGNEGSQHHSSGH